MKDLISKRIEKADKLGYSKERCGDYQYYCIDCKNFFKLASVKPAIRCFQCDPCRKTKGE